MRAAESALAARATWLATAVTGRISERLAAPFIERLWFTPWSVPTTERARTREAAWLDATDPLEVDLGGRRLVGFAAGSGPTVLLVHGWGERASRLGAFVTPLVERGMRVVGVDLPSHGGSDDGPARMAPPDIADAVSAVAARLGGVDAIVAHSIGGPATVIAMQRGLDLRAVALLAPMVRPRHVVDTFGRLFRVPPKAMAALRRSIERRYGAELWEEWAADVIAPGFDVPVLIVSDRDDPQVAHEDHLRLAEAWPGARLHTTDGLGHTRILREASLVEEVADFIATRAGGHGTVVELPREDGVSAS